MMSCLKAGRNVVGFEKKMLSAGLGFRSLELSIKLRML